MSLIQQSARTFVWQVAGFLALVLSGMVTTRYLGPADRGLLAAAYLYPQLATTLGSLSFGVAIIHHYGRRECSSEEFAGTCVAASGGLGVASLGLLLGGAWLGGEPFHRGIPWVILFLVLLPLPGLFALGYFSTLLQAAMDFHWYNLVTHGPKLISLLAVLVLLASGRLAVWELVIVGTVLSAITCLVPVWRMRRHAPGPWRLQGTLFWRLAADGLRIHLGVIAIFLAGRANLFLANFFLAKADVGFLYVAITLAELVWFISVAAETVLYPQAAQMSATDAATLTARVCRQILILSLVAGLGLAVLAPAAVMLYGGRPFLPAVTPLRLLLPGMVALTISKILSALWVRKGWFLTLTLVAGGTGLLSVALNVLLIPLFGTTGAALATTVPYVLNAGVSLLIYRRWVSRDVAMVLRVQREDLAHLMRSVGGWRLSATGPVMKPEKRLP
jgi:O-antigen/teichoic acid export membrane protein